MIYRFACAFLLVMATGLSGSADSEKDDLLITLERTACYGTCPIYKLTIRGDRSVVYEGRKFVRVKGKHKAKLTQQAMAELIDAFNAANYTGLESSYTSIHNPDGTETIVTDLPTTYTSFSLNGKTKAVVDYVGAPNELKELEYKLDTIVGSKRWVSIDASSVHEEAGRGWDIRGSEARKLFADAAERGDAEVVRAFIEEGADVNARIRKLTPLQIAHGPAVVKLLISSGADVNADSSEYFGPPIVLAAHLGDVDSVRALLDAGAKINARSSDGETALIVAAESGDPSLVKLLLWAGADPKARTASGYNALDFAKNGLDKQKALTKHADPFDKALPDYEERYKEIEGMLASAGTEPAK